MKIKDLEEKIDELRWEFEHKKIDSIGLKHQVDSLQSDISILKSEMNDKISFYHLAGLVIGTFIFGWMAKHFF